MKERKLALIDIDKTIYNGLSIFPVAEDQREKGLINNNCLMALGSILGAYKSNEIDYELFVRKLLETWADGLKGLLYTTVLEQATLFLSGESNFFPFTLQLMSVLSKSSYDVYFITGEPQFIGSPVNTILKGSGSISSEFGTDSAGILSGRVSKFLATREEKKEAIGELLSHYDLNGSIAFGDSEGDIEMLTAVESSICINPTKGLERIANEKK